MFKINSKVVKNKIREAFAADAMDCAAEWADWLRGSPEDLAKAKAAGEWDDMERLADLAAVEGSEKGKDAQKLAANFIKRVCIKEKAYNGDEWRESLFIDWLQGLPGAVNSAAWFLGNATKYAADLLGETEEEAAKYGEAEAEMLISVLFYREINQLAD